jgi:hypothetical protein
VSLCFRKPVYVRFTGLPLPPGRPSAGRPLPPDGFLVICLLHLPVFSFRGVLSIGVGFTGLGFAGVAFAGLPLAGLPVAGVRFAGFPLFLGFKFVFGSLGLNLGILFEQ